MKIKIQGIAELTAAIENLTKAILDPAIVDPPTSPIPEEVATPTTTAPLRKRGKKADLIAEIVGLGAPEPAARTSVKQLEAILADLKDTPKKEEEIEPDLPEIGQVDSYDPIKVRELAMRVLNCEDGKSILRDSLNSVGVESITELFETKQDNVGTFVSMMEKKSKVTYAA